MRDHLCKFTVKEVPNYELSLKLSKCAGGAAKMTVLLFAIDYAKERTGISDLVDNEMTLNFDDENLTTAEEILQTKMESVLLKRKGKDNPFTDNYDRNFSEKDVIYLNDKEQLLRVVKITKDSGKVVDVHNILSFDVTKLPHAKMHSYQGEQAMNPAMGMPRAKVPVKDGRS